MRGSVGVSGAPWKGTVESDTQRQYVSKDFPTWQCTNHWHSDISFVVAADGTLTGLGKGTLTSGPTCNAPYGIGSGWATGVNFTITGKKETTDFVLTFGSPQYLPANSFEPAGFGTVFSTFPNYVPVEPGPPMTIPITGATTAGGSVQTSGSITLDASVDPPDPMVSTNVFALTGGCDPTLLLKSRNEFIRADQAFGEADQLAFKTEGEYGRWLQDEEKEFVGISAEKGTLVQVIEGTAKDAGYEHVVGKLVHVFEVDIGPAITAYWLASDIEPHILDHDASMREAAMLSKDGVRTAAQAVADLKAELEQEPACQQQAQAQRAKEDLAAKKRALVDSWEMTPSNLYWNPTRQEWETEGAALKAAEQILTGARRTQALGESSAVPPTRTVRITIAQAKAALPYLERALKLHKDADSRERKTLDRTITFAKAMRKLLKQG